MSTTGYRLSLESATPIAASIVEALEPYCERLCIAGSVRRRVHEIHDVELVVIPAYRQQVLPLFDLPGDSGPHSTSLRATAPPIDCLDERLNDLEHHLEIRKRRDAKGRTFWGPSDKRILWPIRLATLAQGKLGAASTEWIPLDVFGATSATWGAKLMIRTGPWQLSKRLVTQRGKGGVLPDDLEFRAGGLYRYTPEAHRHFVPTPDEETLFRELGLPYVAPEHRFATTYQTVTRSTSLRGRAR